jgi:hypothetical protein
VESGVAMSFDAKTKITKLYLITLSDPDRRIAMKLSVI